MASGLAMLVFMSASSMLTNYYQQRTIHNLMLVIQINNKDINRMLDTQVAQLRILDDYDKRLKKLEKQNDFMVAASRMGWSEAYRFIRQEGEYLTQ
jgi:hypothetical protein